jgi:hypothetical protein
MSAGRAGNTVYSPPVALNSLVCASTTWLQLLQGARSGDATVAQLTIAEGQDRMVTVTLQPAVAPSAGVTLKV